MLLIKELVDVYERLNRVYDLVKDVEDMTYYDDPQASNIAGEAVGEIVCILSVIRDSMDEEPSDLNFEEDT